MLTQVVSEIPRVYKARYVFPIARPPIGDGILVVRGERIEHVGRADGRAVDVELGNAAIIPGLVNAHTHLELGGLRGRLPKPESFTDWLRQVVAFRRSQSDEQLAQAVAEGIQESLAGGVTSLGDISTRGLSYSALSDAPLTSVLFHEVIGLRPQRAAQAYAELVAWLDTHPARNHCQTAVSPHAPYTVSADLYRRLAALAQERGLGVATHWAETPDELRFLKDATGPLADFLAEMGAWSPGDHDVDLINLDQVAACYANVRIALIHNNYVAGPGGEFDPSHHQHLRPFAELARARRWSVVYCPRTHAYFGHVRHPYRALLQWGVNVCLGSDSLASSPTLSMLDEMRQIHETDPDLPFAAVLEMATLRGAVALGLDHETGTLSPGKYADFAVMAFGDRSDTYHDRLLFRPDVRIAATVCRGRCEYGRRL